MAGVVCGLVLLGAGGSPVALPEGLSDSGAPTQWALRVVGLLVDLIGALTVGLLLVAALLFPSRAAQDHLVRTRGRFVALARTGALAWSVVTALLLALQTADATGVALTDLTLQQAARTTSTPEGVGLALAAFTAAGVALAATPGAPVRRVWTLLVTASLALVPAAMTGHPATTSDPAVSAAAVAVHVTAASLWVGGLAALLLVLPRNRSALATALPRFSILALGAYTALAASGLLAAVSMLGFSTSRWSSSYGAVLAVKAALLVGLGALGQQHRRRTLGQVAAGRTDVFLRVAATELLLMGAAFGAAAALGRTPLPEDAAADATEHAEVLVPTALPALSAEELATDWRLNAVLLLPLAVALATYLVGVRRASQRGAPWPLIRTTSFVSGILLAVVGLSSGLARYAHVQLSAQVTQLLVSLLLVPLLLACGAPLTLWFRSAPPQVGKQGLALPDHRTVRLLANPLTGCALVSGLLLALYRTPLVELSLRSFWVHGLVLALAILAGWLLLWPVLGTDPVPGTRREAERALAVVVVGACLLSLALQLLLGDRLLAGSWFIAEGPAGVDAVTDQRLAGAIVALAGALTMLLLGIGLRRGPLDQPDDQSLVTTAPRRSSEFTAP